MEDILRAVSCPFEEENFKKIIDIYLKSQDRYDFYENIVTYQKDVEPGIREEKTNTYMENKNFPYLQVETFSGWGVYRHFSQVFPTQYRIYINASQSGINSLLGYFISECETNNLPFELKYDNVPNSERNDVIIIGSHASVLKNHIEILRQFAKLNPEIVKACGSPHLMTGNLDNWLGLARENNNRFRSYTESMIDIIQESIMKYMLENEKKLGLIDNEDIESFKRSLDYFEKRQQNSKENLENDVGRHCKIGNEIKQKLAIAISEQPDLINDIRDVFISVCAEHQLDTSNPIFNENYQVGLKQNSVESKKVIGDDIIDLLNQADATHIFNYLTDENIEQLNTQSIMKIMKLFVEKDISEKIRGLRMIRDVEDLHVLGFISDETFRQFISTYDGDYTRVLEDCNYKLGNFGCHYNAYLHEHLDDTTLASDVFLMKRNEEYFRSGNGMPFVSIGKKEQSQKVRERISDIITYYSEMKVDEQAMQRRISNSKRVAESLGKNLFFPKNQIGILKNDVFMLEHVSEKREQIEEVSRKICEELTLVLTNNKGIENVRQAIVKYNEIGADDVDRDDY